MSRNTKFLLRIVQYIIGLLILAFGVTISINSDLGVSPVSALPYVVSVVWDMSLSTCVIIVFSSYIVMQIFILGKEFKWYNLFQLAFSTIYGYFTDFTKWVIGDFALPGYGGRLIMMVVSTIIISAGTTIYVGAKLVPMPMDGISLALAQKLGTDSFPKMKGITGCISVLVCVLICLIFNGGKVVGVREGTVFTAVFVGVFVSVWRKFLNPIMNKLQD